MKYCNICGKYIQPTKKFSIGWFLANCIWIIGGGMYILYWIFLKERVCPICNGNQFSKSSSTEVLDQTIAMSQIPIKNILELNKKELAVAKTRTDETARKRKVGKLPWQFKKAETKSTKLDKLI
ncbi:MAG TPA: hypothetical protein VIK72_14405 [Clostridiaceae bacterium]